MVQFKAGYWLIGISLYFFLLFTIINIYSASFKDYDNVNTNQMYAKNLPFPYNDTYSQTGYLSSINESGTSGLKANKFLDVLSFASGIGDNQIGIGLPIQFKWLFNFFFFWIPSFILMFSIYMLIPFI